MSDTVTTAFENSGMVDSLISTQVLAFGETEILANESPTWVDGFRADSGEHSFALGGRWLTTNIAKHVRRGDMLSGS